VLSGLLFAICLAGPGAVRVEDRGAPAFEHFVRGEIYLQRGDLHDAEAELRYAIAFDHDSPYLRHTLDQVLTAQAHAGALTHLQHSLR